MKLTIKRSKGKNPLGKLFAREPSIAAEAEYRKLMIVEELLTLMKEKGISRSELAKRMEVQPSRVTAMLSGASNLTIDTLVRAGRAVGADLHQHYVVAGHVAHFNTCHSDDIDDAFNVRVAPVHRSKAHFKLGPDAFEDNADAA
jgi:transcriptional regulator with XRE-family HTH domain